MGRIAEINVFGFWRIVMCDGADWTTTGKLFQSRGPAAAKGRFKMNDFLVSLLLSVN